MKPQWIAGLLMMTMTGAGALAQSSDQALQLAYQMQAAVLESQDTAKVEALLHQGVDINAPIGCGTYCPVDGAIDRQNVGMLEFLLAHGAKPPERSLAKAAFVSGHQQALEMTKALIDAGMDPNASERGDTTALISATYRGNQELVGYLLARRGVKLDEFDVDGFSALMWAIKHGSSQIVDLLLRAGAKADVANRRGETAATVANQEIQKQQAILAKLNAASR